MTYELIIRISFGAYEIYKYYFINCSRRKIYML